MVITANTKVIITTVMFWVAKTKHDKTRYFEPKAGLRKINRYSESFKATAVNLAHVKGIKIKDVAQSLDIHSFMLSRWIKEVREGKIVAKGK
jgi:transposase-like protein